MPSSQFATPAGVISQGPSFGSSSHSYYIDVSETVGSRHAQP